MNVITNQMNNLNVNENNEYVDWVNHDPNKITELIDTVKNDYQSDIILSLFTNLSNKMYLVDYREDKHTLDIDLLGSKRTSKQSREKYTVVFDKLHSNFTCNCKDFIYRSKSRDIVCKHITFIICKVLSIYDHEFYETKKLSQEYQKRLYMIIGNSGVWNNNHISIKHMNSEFNKNTKTLNVDDTCPICCDLLSSDDALISCPECNNYVHKQCMDVWIQQSKTCIYCRNSWDNYIKDSEL